MTTARVPKKLQESDSARQFEAADAAVDRIVNRLLADLEAQTMTKLLALCAAVLLVSSAPARAWRDDPASRLAQDQIDIIEDLAIAKVATDKCPGLHFVDPPRPQLDKIFTDEQVDGEDWHKAIHTGYISATNGYLRDQRGFCDSVWKQLGPDHPAAVKFQLLEKKRGKS
jgi:hypothetical protein